ncbi:8-oxo-dGTP diphosphatase [Algoriphagus ratkowskyi]|uniref:8-oxo-dGTP diphosphatase n=1 Tax=Algoriphagus ratkowskyi TaxID=57028 RepID=A0A2W7QM78_9BACT|nr:NUDIX hydrolase [Algoriphagus ratkowskyi]PZX49563.1 8-oxo-dGTP diphosphatase [Algoriphagus ratkowskyi]TXD75427.1 NUDIX hydrolase [Algoriphagus ratkowskyi]
MSKDRISKEIESKFGNHLRSRVNGILIEDGKILMIKHLMGNGKMLWSVPGGGMHFGQSASENLKREFSEETGLDIEVKAYLFIHEYLAVPLHAMEHFFSVEKIGGKLTLGTDPELYPDSQIIEEISWMDINEIRSLPNEALHQIFWGINSLEDLVLLRGYFNFENNSLK